MKKDLHRFSHRCWNLAFSNNFGNQKLKEGMVQCSRNPDVNPIYGQCFETVPQKDRVQLQHM